MRSATVLEPLPLKAEQSNTSVVYGDVFVLKLYRRLHEGVNPDLEVGRYLTETCNFRNIAPVAGALELRRRNQEPLTLAMLQVFLPALGDAWRYTQDAVGRYFTEVQARQAEVGAASVPQQPLLALLDGESPISRRRIHWPLPGECPVIGPAHRRTARGTRTGLGQPQLYPRILDGL